MEYYKGNILANIAIGTNKKYVAKWFSKEKSISDFEKGWVNEFHIWRMIWDENFVQLFVDNYLINKVAVSELQNPDGFNPFMQPHYILLNLAVGGDNGGDPSLTTFPQRYYIDYVRVYQKK